MRYCHKEQCYDWLKLSPWSCLWSKHWDPVPMWSIASWSWLDFSYTKVPSLLVDTFFTSNSSSDVTVLIMQCKRQSNDRSIALKHSFMTDLAIFIGAITGLISGMNLKCSDRLYLSKGIRMNRWKGCVSLPPGHTPTTFHECGMPESQLWQKTVLIPQSKGN